jgi:hypothetical protein
LPIASSGGKVHADDDANASDEAVALPSVLPSGLERWLAGLRRDVALDAALRQTDLATGDGHGCSCRTVALGMLALCGVTCLLAVISMLVASAAMAGQGVVVGVADDGGTVVLEVVED